MEKALRILIVDDNVEFAESLKDIFEAEIYAVTVASTGAGAIDFCSKTPLGLALIDVRLPDISGPELIEKLSLKCPEMEYIIITGNASIETATSAVGQKKILAYLNKPLDMERLLPFIRQVAERQQAEAALKNSEIQYRRIVETANEGIWIADVAGFTTFVNARMAGMLGYRPEEMIGKPAGSFSDEEGKARSRDIIARITQGKPARMELKHLRKDGSILWTMASAAPLYDERGNVTAIMAMHSDVTERKRLENELRRSNLELQQFAYIISHDLQEPLRMIASYLQLLEKRYKGKLDSDADDFINFAVDGANRMRDMIISLLEYSRIETRGKSPEPVNSNEALVLALENLGIAIQDNKAAVTCDTLPVVMVDPTQLMQLFQNLIGNAIKFHGANTPHVHVSARKEGDEYIFSVKDNGIGIDSKYYPRIFRIFQRLHTRDEYPGTGMGLAISKRIVERHGGRIWVESEKGKGATFLFTLKDGNAG